MDHISSSDKKGDVISPRLTLKYDIKQYLQARISYSQGYRAPQVFDEDLHIETSGARKVIHVNDPGLQKETSHSYLASLDFNKKLDGIYLGLLVEGFYTRLIHPFANEFTEPNEQGTVIYTRVNAEKGASVRGVNLEMKAVPSKNMTFKSGFTTQLSEYEENQEFGETKFFRTPNDYGFITMDYKLSKAWKVSSTGNYTGKMLIPYFGPGLPNPTKGELRETGVFFDLGMKISYSTRLNGATLQLFTGAKNIFNSYQDDFDSGINRDPAYIYGPLLPRTVYFGIKIGNKLERN
jgi:outer membrane receptor for ferrienterochelin and colicins